MDLKEICVAVELGKGKRVKELVNQAVDEGLSVKMILDDGLILAMSMVAMMMKGMGATVYDLGVDVSDHTFVEKAEEVGADIICISALLTTTMPAIGDVIKEFEKSGVRDKYYIMVGGAPVSQIYADQVGANAYSSNASEAADVAKAYLLSMTK